MEKNDIKLIKILKDMLYSPEQYFEKDLAIYILKRLNLEDFKNTLFRKEGYNNGTRYNIVHTSFWGLVCSNYREIYSIPKKDEQDNPIHAERNYQSSLLNHNRLKQEKNDWQIILESVSTDLTLPPMYMYKGKEEINVDFKGWFALNETNKWLNLYIENPMEWRINEIEEKHVIKNLLSENNIYIHNINEKKEKQCIGIILKMLNHYKEQVKIEILSEIEDVNIKDENIISEKWIEVLFYSKAMKKLLESGETKDITQLFNENDLRFLIKKSNIKNNVDQNAELLSNVLPIASPEKWLRAYTKNKSFNINSFFEVKFKKAYGISLIKSNIKKTPKYPHVQKVLLEEINYLKSALKNIHILEDEKLKIWFKIIKTEDVELLKSMATSIGLPLLTNNEKSQKLYNDLTIIELTNGQNETRTINDWIKVAQYEELQNMIPQKLNTIKEKKLKI